MTSFELRIVNPKTSEERSLVIRADLAAAEASPDWQAYVQAIARPSLPTGFMCISGRVRRLELQ